MPIPIAAAAAWETGGPDEGVFRALNLAGTNPVLDGVMLFFTWIGVAYLIALLAVPLWWGRQKALAVDYLVLLAIVIVVTEGLKFLLQVPRPCDVLPDVRTLSASACAAEFDPAFPSGHTSRAFAMAALLAVRLRWRAGVPAFAVAALIGLSRIYLGVHWPSDVAAGALLGAGLALAFVLVEKRFAAYRAGRDRLVAAVDRLFHGRGNA